MVMNALIVPRKNPIVTCMRLCCRKIIRLEPTIPDAMMTKQSHQIGLKLSINENAINPPNTPPIAAVWVDIFQ